MCIYLQFHNVPVRGLRVKIVNLSIIRKWIAMGITLYIMHIYIYHMNITYFLVHSVNPCISHFFLAKKIMSVDDYPVASLQSCSLQEARILKTLWNAYNLTIEIFYRWYIYKAMMMVLIQYLDK